MSAHAFPHSHSSSTSTSSSSSSIRRASEDSRFRAFLSAHFDAQAHVTSVIQEGKSEEVFADISTCIDEVDEEIKNYISLHKHDLMAGMQDVAVLSKRYQSLQATSHRLLLAVDKTKRESFASHALVRARTVELERIHHTAVLLRQLRQFTHAKAQLDHYSSPEAGGRGSSGGAADLDLRQFATIAKTVQELEQLLLSPQLVALQVVSSQVARIRTFGAQLRDLAREKLLGALRAQDQATVADCLQVFFNLHSLPQVVLMAIDATVKDTIDLSVGALNLELVMEGGANNSGSDSIGKAPSSKMKNKGAGGGDALLSNASQLRVAMREMCHSWAGMLQEQAVQVLVLQRVIAKKEDPATHQTFSAVLLGQEQQRHGQGGAAGGLNSSSEEERSQAAAFALAFSGSSSFKSGQPFSLLEIFWNRLAVSLQDVLGSKIKQYPVAAPRIYPNLRRSVIEVYVALKGLAAGDSAQMHGFEGDSMCGAHGLMEYYNDFHGDEYGLDEDDGEVDAYSSSSTSAGVARGGRCAVSLFGSMGLATSPSLLGSSSSGLVVTPATYGSIRHKQLRGGGAGGTSPRSSASMGRSTSSSGGLHVTEDSSLSSEAGLLPSLTPLRDRYLLAALSRMTAPVLQMFPEVEGYTAAVPSKRDLQALLRTIQEEVAHVVLEGDRSLVRILAKEALKAVRLLLTKVEGMVSTGVESTRIHMGKGGHYAKTNQQEHNCQLLQLLFQLIEFINKLPSQIIKATKDSPSFALSRLLSGSESSAAGPQDEGGSGEAVLREEMSYFVRESVRCAQELAGRQLLHPLVEALASHFRQVLLGLLQEGVSTSVSGVGGAPGTSRTLSAVLDQFPRAVDTFLLATSSSSSGQPVAVAVEELCARLVLIYTSVAALRRPVTEQSRLLTAAEISAVDMMVTGLLAPLPLPSALPHPVLAELRSFRRLLFDPIEEARGDGTPQVLGADVECCPQPSRVLALPYFQSLRPSTVLGYLVACGPRQLPSLPDAPSTTAPAVSSDPSVGSTNTLGTSSDRRKKAVQSLDPLALSSDATAAYIKVLTAALDGTSSPYASASFLAQGSPEGGSGQGLVASLLGASVRPIYPIASSSGWKQMSAPERRSVEMARQCLDVFKQRITVCDEAQKKPLLAWYEALLSLCHSFLE